MDKAKVISLFRNGNFSDLKQYMLSNEHQVSDILLVLIDNININEIEDKLGEFIRENFKYKLSNIKYSSINY